MVVHYHIGAPDITILMTHGHVHKDHYILQLLKSISEAHLTACQMCFEIALQQISDPCINVGQRDYIWSESVELVHVFRMGVDCYQCKLPFTGDLQDLET